MYKGKLLTGAVLSVFMAGAYGNACAADGTSDAVYSLNPVVVTATRYEKSDAEIPAATQTFTEEQGVRIFFWTILVVLTLSLSFLCILLDSCRPR